jgi:hypothetical protein
MVAIAGSAMVIVIIGLPPASLIEGRRLEIKAGLR